MLLFIVAASYILVGSNNLNRHLVNRIKWDQGSASLAFQVFWRPFLELLLKKVLRAVILILDTKWFPNIRVPFNLFTEIFIQISTNSLEITIPVWSFYSLNTQLWKT